MPCSPRFTDLWSVVKLEAGRENTRTPRKRPSAASTRFEIWMVDCFDTRQITGSLMNRPL